MMRHPTDETRAKISAAMMGRTAWNKGMSMSDEQKAKMSAAKMGNTYRLGSHPSEETLAKMSAAHKGNTSAIGHEISPEVRAKISAALTGRVVSPETRAKESAAQWKGGRAVCRRKKHAKRRALGFVPLNEPFPGCEGHHVDNEQVIHMPQKLHRSIRHNHYTGQGMAQINTIAYNYLFKQEVEAAMAKVSQ